MVSRSRCSSLLTRKHNATRSGELRLASFVVIYPPSLTCAARGPAPPTITSREHLAHGESSFGPRHSRHSSFRRLCPRARSWFQRDRLEVQNLRLRRVSSHGPAEPFRSVHLDIQDGVDAVAVPLRISIFDDVADHSLVHPGLPNLLAGEVSVRILRRRMSQIEVCRPAPQIHVLMRQLPILRDRVFFQVPRDVPVTPLDSAHLLLKTLLPLGEACEALHQQHPLALHLR